MTQAKTRIVHLAAGQERKEADNARTCIVVFEKPPAAHSFRNLFIRNYAAIQSECTAHSYPGLAIVAVDIFRGVIAGSMYLAAKVNMPNSAIIGRHGMADLYLEGDGGLSLRHLAIITSPLTATHAEVRYRIMDLRTATAFQDEHGERFEALVSEGPLFIRCSGYAIFCIPTGDAASWPARAEDGWSCIPERVHLRGHAAEPDRWQRKRIGNGARRRKGEHGEESHSRGAVTLIRSLAGPVRARAQLVVPGEESLGTLRITTEAGVQALAIGPRAAEQGVVLGRYERCDVDGVNVLTHNGISRVHLLIIDIDQRLYAIDTGSSQGTWLTSEEREIRITPMVAGTELSLGNELASLRWSPA